MCCITTDESYFILKYVPDNVVAALENKEEMVTEDGIEDAFDVLGEIEEIVKTGVWVGDFIIFNFLCSRYLELPLNITEKIVE